MRGRKPNLIACVNCRQMKLACDRNKQFPSACSRCTKAGKICSVDPSFKREKKRERLKAVEKELERVKQSSQAQTRATQNYSDRRTLGSPSANSLTPLIEEDPESSPVSKTINGVHLPAPLILDLLNEYYANYHPFCPILPSLSSFLSYSDPCPFLFCTVLITALRRKSEYSELYLRLVDVVRMMACESMWPENGSLLSLQALLLLCYWPLPFKKRRENLSHSFIALATHLGLRLGLHRPHHAKEFGGESDSRTQEIQRVTWAVCFTMNVSMSAQLGLPATTRPDQSLLELLALKPSWLPETLYRQLHFARQALNICSTLGYCETSSTGLLNEPTLFIQNFETDLRALECQFSGSWSPADHLVFLGCKSMLYTFAVTSVNQKPNGSESTSHWLIHAYITATATIQTSLSMKGQLSYAPSRLHMGLINAMCFLLLLKCSSYYDRVDKSTLDSGVSQGWELLHGLSVTSGDFTSRACFLLEKLSRYSDVISPEDRTEDFLLVWLRLVSNVSFSTARAREYLIGTQEEPAWNNASTSYQPVDMTSVDDVDLLAELDWDSFLVWDGAQSGYH